VQGVFPDSLNWNRTQNARLISLIHPTRFTEKMPTHYGAIIPNFTIVISIVIVTTEDGRVRPKHVLIEFKK
jgi:hypothetical protein